MSNNRNICKFVEETFEESIVTTRFIYETAVPAAGWRDIIPCDAMFLVAGGKGTFFNGFVTVPITVGDLFFAFPGQQITVTDEGGLAYMYIYFSGGRVHKLYAKFGISPSRFLFGDMESLVPIWKDSLVRADEKNVDLLSESMLLYAFSRLTSEKNEDGEMIRGFTEYMEAHYRDSDCTLQSVAAALGYNSKYLSHRVKQKMGTGFSEYLKNLRLRYAVLLIGQGMTSVKNVAILTGFSDPMYFSKIFKQTFGRAPRDFMNEMKQ